MYRFDDRSGNDSIGEALDILNSGDLNFSTVSENAASASKVITIKVFEATPESMGKHKIPATALGYLHRGAIYHNASLSDGDLSRVIGNVVHEALHTSRDIDRLVDDAISRPEFASFTADQKERLGTILEEKALRDVLSEIDARSDLFSLSDGRLNYNGSDILDLIEAYDNAAGRPNVLTPAQEALVAQYVADVYSPPVFELDGAIYSPDANGDYQPYSLVDGAPGDNVIGDGYAYDYTQDIDSESVAEVNAQGQVVVSPFPVPRPDGLTGTSSTTTSSKPIILDLDGDGVEISLTNEVSFDLDEDGFLERTSWVGSDDGFLVVDLAADGSFSGGDGVIDQARELALSLWGPEGSTDLQALAEARDVGGNLLFDSNGDGVLNGSDTLWSSFKVWKDTNQNGITDAGELLSLASLGITGINLTYDDGTGFDDTSNDVDVFGNTLFGLASYTRDGVIVEGAVGDTALAYNTEGWSRVETGLGYNIELETGEILRYAELSGVGSAALNLGALALDGAAGDHRANSLLASTSQVEVTISGLAGDDNIVGSAFDDALSGDEGNDTILGGVGNDFLSGDSGDDLLRGGDGDDVLSGGSGDDELRGGLGDDTYVYDLTDGHITIDESVFEVNGVQQDSSEGLSATPVTVGGKGGGSSYNWVHDTISGATVTPLAAGRDTISFTDDIGIADLVFSNDATVLQPNGSQIIPKEYDMKIEFLDETENLRSNQSITIKNWGDSNFQIEELQFSNGFSEDIDTGFFLLGFLGGFAAGLVGNHSGNVLAASYSANGHGVWVTALGGDDLINGTYDADFINGGSGNDIISGGTDTRNMGSVDDVFIFDEDDGADVITDFTVGMDKILFDIRHLDFGALTIDDTSDGARILYDDDDTITLNGIQANQLTADDFIFA